MISLGSHQNIGLHTVAHAHVVLLTYFKVVIREIIGCFSVGSMKFTNPEVYKWILIPTGLSSISLICFCYLFAWLMQ